MPREVLRNTLKTIQRHTLRHENKVHPRGISELTLVLTNAVRLQPRSMIDQGSFGTNYHYGSYGIYTVGCFRCVSLSDGVSDSPGHASERVFSDLTMGRLYIPDIAERAAAGIQLADAERPPSRGR